MVLKYACSRKQLALNMVQDLTKKLEQKWRAPTEFAIEDVTDTPDDKNMTYLLKRLM